MKVATVIMHYEYEDLTNQVLAQLSGLSDLFVFDDGSSHLFEPASKATVIAIPENRGYVKAVNEALRVLGNLHTVCASDPYDAVWTLNNDVEGLTGELLEALSQALEKNKHLAAVSPAIAGNGHHEMRPGNEFRGRIDPKARRESFIDWVCPLVRMSAWLDVGGFDESLPGYGVDVDFCKRARDREWRFAVLPQFTIQHEGRGTVKHLPDKADHANIGLMNKLLCAKWGVRR